MLTHPYLTMNSRKKIDTSIAVPLSLFFQVLHTCVINMSLQASQCGTKYVGIKMTTEWHVQQVWEVDLS